MNLMVMAGQVLIRQANLLSRLAERWVLAMPA